LIFVETMMTIIFDREFSIFAKKALPFLSRQEAKNNLILGIIGFNLSKPKSLKKIHSKKKNTSFNLAPLLISIKKNNKLKSFALQTPPHNLVLTKSTKDDLELLANELFKKGASIPGVVGPIKEVDNFAHFWSQKTGQKKILAMEQKIFSLSKIKPPQKIPGQMLKVPINDAKTVAKWCQLFSKEALRHEGGLKKYKRALEFAHGRIKSGEIFGWYQGNKLKAISALSGPTPKGIRVSLVYTPLKWRGQGLATNLVATLSDYALTHLNRKYCFLYTDQSNPISNSIYQKIGYKCVGDSRHYMFQ